MAHLVLIETAGNQDFIFATNKLRENVGASELIHRIGTTFVLKAVAEIEPAYRTLAEKLQDAIRVTGIRNGRKQYGGSAVPTAHYVRALVDIARSNALGPDTPVDVVVATSGKAVLLVDTRATGEAIIQRVTLRALRDAPGAVVRGTVSEELDLDADRAVAHSRMKGIHEAVNELRRKLPPPEARFPTLPIVAPCASSGLPAECLDRRDGSLVSAPVAAKREAADAGWRRVVASLGTIGTTFARNVEDLEELKLDWLGVVHADGNGFGKVFLDLANCMPVGTTARDYCNFYRDLSLALEMAGTAALRSAAESLKAALERIDVEIDPAKGKPLPLVPLVSGGDDLTVICDGRRAVTFAEHYLKAFEDATGAPAIDDFASVIPTLLDPNSKEKPRRPKDGFGGGAGVAIVKPHHPFHRAYHLAEDLTRSAKVTKRILGTDAISALDFQVVYNDAASDLRTLRAGWSRKELRGETLFHARPYVVSDKERRDRAKDNCDWSELHHIRRLQCAMAVLKSTGDDEQDKARKVLPRSQQHALREALFIGVPDERLALVRERYKNIDWCGFGERPTSLFFEEKSADGAEDERVRRTRLLDAMELIDVGELPAAAEEEPRKIGGTAE